MKEKGNFTVFAHHDILSLFSFLFFIYLCLDFFKARYEERINYTSLWLYDVTNILYLLDCKRYLYYFLFLKYLRLVFQLSFRAKKIILNYLDINLRLSIHTFFHGNLKTRLATLKRYCRTFASNFYTLISILV